MPGAAMRIIHEPAAGFEAIEMKFPIADEADPFEPGVSPLQSHLNGAKLPPVNLTRCLPVNIPHPGLRPFGRRDTRLTTK